MRILAFSPYPPEEGGGSKATFEIFKRMEKDSEIVLVTYQKESTKLENVRVHHFNLNQKTSMLKGFNYITRGIRKGVRIGKEFKPDIIYAKNATSPGIVGYNVAKKLGIPFVVHTSGPEVQDLSLLSKTYGACGMLYVKLLTHYRKKILENASFIIANSKTDERAIRKIVKNKGIEMIYNGVDHNRYKPDLKNRKAVRKELNIRDNEIAVAYTGRAAKEKNLGGILKLSGELKKTKFIFVGPTLEELKRIGRVNENCIALGKRTDVERYLQGADIFLLPSLGEGLSNSMLEAMSTGLPVVVYPAGDARFIVNKENGFLVDDYDSLKEKIMVLSEDKKLRERMGKNSRRLIMKNFNWEACSKKISEVLKRRC